MTDRIPAPDGRPAAILLARSAIAAAPIREMAALAAQLEASGRVAKALYAFSEQGLPTLKTVVDDLRVAGVCDIVILPFMAPMEANFPAWITRTLQRWHVEAGGEWPAFRIGQSLAASEDLSMLLEAMLDSALAATPPAPNPKIWNEGSIISERKYRVLVCQGAACNQAGAALVWGRLRNLQVEMKLPDLGDGMRSAKTTCLGPCALGPVVQVYPEGTFYGGVDEAGLDRIVHEHLLAGAVVEYLEYRPAPGKQRLRKWEDRDASAAELSS